MNHTTSISKLLIAPIASVSLGPITKRVSKKQFHYMLAQLL